MTHLVRAEPWGITDLDLTKGHVFVRQDWRYLWENRSDVAPWTSSEKEAYHHAVDHLIWAHWSMRARVFVKVNATVPPDVVGIELANRFGQLGMTLSFDVRSVQGPSHWRATVTKVDPDKRPHPQASCAFELRQLTLFNIDVLPHVAQRFRGTDPRAQKNFYVTAHEFGHAIGYGYSRGKGEENKAGHRYYNDVHSIMNIGRHVRARHFFLITETLRRMVPSCDFNVVVEQ